MRYALLLAVLAVPGSLFAAEPAPIARWIDDLGHDDFARREAATVKLAEAGESALSALVEASAVEEPEVAWRIRQALTQIANASEESRTAVGDALRTAGREGLARTVTEKPSITIKCGLSPTPVIYTTIPSSIYLDSSFESSYIDSSTIMLEDAESMERFRVLIEQATRDFEVSRPDE